MALTIREALEAQIGMSVDPKLIDLELINLGINEADNYLGTEGQRQLLKQGEISVLTRATVLKQFTEGDLTIQYNLDAINARLAVLNPPVVDTTPKNTINVFPW